MISNHVSLGFARRVEALGVTVAEWVFLRELYDAEPVAPARLAGRMGMTRGAISKLADRLLAKALIERRAGSGDARGQLLALSPQGRHLVPQLAALADANDAAFFGCLGAGERAQLASALKKIVEKRGLKGSPVT